MRQWAQLRAGQRCRLAGAIAVTAVAVAACGGTAARQTGSGERLTAHASALAAGSRGTGAAPSPGVTRAAAVRAKTAVGGASPAATAPAHFRRGSAGPPR